MSSRHGGGSFAIGSGLLGLFGRKPSRPEPTTTGLRVAVGRVRHRLPPTLSRSSQHHAFGAPLADPEHPGQGGDVAVAGTCCVAPGRCAASAAISRGPNAGRPFQQRQE